MTEWLFPPPELAANHIQIIKRYMVARWETFVQSDFICF